MTADNEHDLPEPAGRRPLPGSVGLSRQINRRRLLRRGADGVFAGVMAMALGEAFSSQPDGAAARRTGLTSRATRAFRIIPNYAQDCESHTGACCPYTCCGPSPCCNTSCCTQNCCSALGSSSCAHCSYNGDWSGASCWQKTSSCGTNCAIVVTCCDCNSRCSGGGISGICICTSRAKFQDGSWSRWDPLTSRWIPANEDPLAEIA